MEYNTLRHLADSWGLVFLFAIFAIAIWMAFRPAAKKGHEHAQMIPLRDDEADQ